MIFNYFLKRNIFIQAEKTDGKLQLCDTCLVKLAEMKNLPQDKLDMLKEVAAACKEATANPANE